MAMLTYYKRLLESRDRILTIYDEVIWKWREIQFRKALAEQSIRSIVARKD